MAGPDAVTRLSVLLLGLLGVALRPAAVLAREKPTVVITVYNRAKMQSSTLTAGQNVAQKILLRAGVKSVWINCPVPSIPEANPECRQPPGPTRLVLTVVPRWAGPRVSSDTLGLALKTADGFGSYCYVFRERLDELAATKHVNPARLLGHAMAHEIGHLLKGANSHSPAGLMSAHWFANEIQAVAMGLLTFTAEDAALMGTRLAQASGSK
jgi:hypothetical protein